VTVVPDTFNQDGMSLEIVDVDGNVIPIARKPQCKMFHDHFRRMVDAFRLKIAVSSSGGKPSLSKREIL
jgi:hypothetical protein